MVSTKVSVQKKAKTKKSLKPVLKPDKKPQIKQFKKVVLKNEKPTVPVLKANRPAPTDSPVVKKTINDGKQDVNKARIRNVMPSKGVTYKIIDLALSAMQQLVEEYNKKKNTILDDEIPIFAELRCIKIQNGKGNVKFVLPHSTVASTGEVCLVTPDLKKGKKKDHEPTIDHWEEILRKAKITNVKTILPLRQLRVEYDQYELKRRLLTQHDFIMVDTKILNHVSHVLGKKFFQKHNMLIPVRFDDKKDVEKSIQTGLRTAMLRLNEGGSSVVVIGHTGMPQDHLKANIKSLVGQLREKYPGGDSNIRSISIKLPLSLSIPLYLTLRSSSKVAIPKLVHKKPKSFTIVEDELSTMADATVRVAPDGTVRVKRAQKPSNKKVENDNQDVESEIEHSEEEISEDENDNTD